MCNIKQLYSNSNYFSIVLTASHCIDEHYNMFVTAGRSTKYDNENVQIVGVEKTLPHENYLLDPNGIQAYYDIGLLRLQTPLTFNEYVKPIEWTTIDIGNPQVTIYGWGSTDAFQNRPSYYLRAKNITLISDSLCIDMLNKAITKCNKQVYELCAEKSACHGDSGSPIVQKVDNVTKLIGVTSWLADDNIDCNTGPAVFENVGYFSKWIKEGIRALMKGNVTENLDDSENVVQTHH